MTDITIDIIDILELIDFTLSENFVEKWRYKYSKRFITHFQLRLLQCMNDSKPLKLDTLATYLISKCKYSPVQVNNFFKSIDISLYSPIIYGKIKSY